MSKNKIVNKPAEKNVIPPIDVADLLLEIWYANEDYGFLIQIFWISFLRNLFQVKSLQLFQLLTVELDLMSFKTLKIYCD
jgi:hypothetical protein